MIDVPRLLARLGIEAKRQGREWVAKCPNPDHEDHSPSWRIRDEPGSSRHGFMHCWPCGFGGTPVDLVAKVLGIEDKRDARAWLEQEAPVDQKPVERVELRVAATSSFRMPPEFVEAPLEDWPSPARDYLRRRGIEDWQVERWGIGYAVSGRLGGRIVVPSRDPAGKPRRYTARTFADDPQRYLQPNPEEHAAANAVFGEQHWPLLNGDEDRDLLFVLEGEINGLALEAELPGVYFGAISGSDLAGGRAIKLSTWSRLAILTDPDVAGDTIAKTIEIAMARHCTTRRLRLPGGTDPSKLREASPGLLGSLVRAFLRETSWRTDTSPCSGS